MSNKFKIHCFHGKLRKKREANQIQTESKACVTISNFAAKARLLARVGCVTKHRLNTTVSASLEVLGEAAWLATEGPERRIEEREVRR